MLGHCDLVNTFTGTSIFHLSFNRDMFRGKCSAGGCCCGKRGAATGMRCENFSVLHAVFFPGSSILVRSSLQDRKVRGLRGSISKHLALDRTIDAVLEELARPVKVCEKPH
jgi:hypothetical protein